MILHLVQTTFKSGYSTAQLKIDCSVNQLHCVLNHTQNSMTTRDSTGYSVNAFRAGQQHIYTICFFLATQPQVSAFCTLICPMMMYHSSEFVTVALEWHVNIAGKRSTYKLENDVHSIILLILPFLCFFATILVPFYWTSANLSSVKNTPTNLNGVLITYFSAPFVSFTKEFYMPHLLHKL